MQRITKRITAFVLALIMAVAAIGFMPMALQAEEYGNDYVYLPYEPEENEYENEYEYEYEDEYDYEDEDEDKEVLLAPLAYIPFVPFSGQNEGLRVFFSTEPNGAGDTFAPNTAPPLRAGSISYLNFDFYGNNHLDNLQPLLVMQLIGPSDGIRLEMECIWRPDGTGQPGVITQRSGPGQPGLFNWLSPSTGPNIITGIHPNFRIGSGVVGQASPGGTSFANYSFRLVVENNIVPGSYTIRIHLIDYLGIPSPGTPIGFLDIPFTIVESPTGLIVTPGTPGGRWPAMLTGAANQHTISVTGVPANADWTNYEIRWFHYENSNHPNMTIQTNTVRIAGDGTVGDHTSYLVLEGYGPVGVNDFLAVIYCSLTGTPVNAVAAPSGVPLASPYAGFAAVEFRVSAFPHAIEAHDSIDPANVIVPLGATLPLEVTLVPTTFGGWLPNTTRIEWRYYNTFFIDVVPGLQASPTARFADVTGLNVGESVLWALYYVPDNVIRDGTGAVASQMFDITVVSPELAFYQPASYTPWRHHVRQGDTLDLEAAFYHDGSVLPIGWTLDWSVQNHFGNEITYAHTANTDLEPGQYMGITLTAEALGYAIVVLTLYDAGGVYASSLTYFITTHPGFIEPNDDLDAIEDPLVTINVYLGDEVELGVRPGPFPEFDNFGSTWSDDPGSWIIEWDYNEDYVTREGHGFDVTFTAVGLHSSATIEITATARHTHPNPSNPISLWESDVVFTLVITPPPPTDIVAVGQTDFALPSGVSIPISVELIPAILNTLDDPLPSSGDWDIDWVIDPPSGINWCPVNDDPADQFNRYVVFSGPAAPSGPGYVRVYARLVYNNTPTLDDPYVVFRFWPIPNALENVTTGLLDPYVVRLYMGGFDGTAGFYDNWDVEVEIIDNQFDLDNLPWGWNVSWVITGDDIVEVTPDTGNGLIATIEAQGVEGSTWVAAFLTRYIPSYGYTIVDTVVFEVIINFHPHLPTGLERAPGIGDRVYVEYQDSRELETTLVELLNYGKPATGWFVRWTVNGSSALLDNTYTVIAEGDLAEYIYAVGNGSSIVYAQLVDDTGAEPRLVGDPVRFEVITVPHGITNVTALPLYPQFRVGHPIRRFEVATYPAGINLPWGWEVRWTTNDPDVATIWSPGMFEYATAHSAGPVTITARVYRPDGSNMVPTGMYQDFEIIVGEQQFDAVARPVGDDKFTIFVGEDRQLAVELLLDGVLQNPLPQGWTVAWSSDDAAVSVVNGLIYGEDEGSATITAEFLFNGQWVQPSGAVVTFDVTVIPVPPPVPTFRHVGNIQRNVVLGEDYQLAVELLLDGVLQNPLPQGWTVVWRTSDASIATVPYTTGLVTGVELGPVYITAEFFYNGQWFDGGIAVLTFEVTVVEEDEVGPQPGEFVINFVPNSHASAGLLGERIDLEITGFDYLGTANDRFMLIVVRWVGNNIVFAAELPIAGDITTIFFNDNATRIDVFLVDGLPDFLGGNGTMRGSDSWER